MKLKWLGHACFFFTSDSGVRILADPFDEEVGYRLPAVEADIVTTSHGHSDHDYIKAVKGEFIHIDQPGKYSKNGIDITGIWTFHDEAGGEKRGKNVINKYIIDGISLCHCGDLGHVLTPQQVQEIGAVDILMVPVGGYYTIDSIKAAEVVKQLKPMLIIPMHFKTSVLDYPIDTVDSFMEIMGNGRKLDRQEIELSKSTLDEYAGTILLNYE